MLPFDVILFDWGGTLADVSRQVESFRRGASEAGILAADTGTHTDTDAGEAVDRLVTAVQTAEARAAQDPELREADLTEIVRRWLGTLGNQPRLDRLDEAIDTLGRIWLGSLDPIPGAEAALSTLRARGYRMGLVSNCMLPPRFALQELARHGFAPHLDFALFSSGVGYRKPSPVFYGAALDQAFPGTPPGDPPRVLFVGDSPGLDVIAPAALGMKTALVPRPPGAWPEADYARARPDFRLDTVADLPDLQAS